MSWWHPDFLKSSRKNNRSQQKRVGIGPATPERGEWAIDADHISAVVELRIVAVFKANDCLLTTSQLSERFDVDGATARRVLKSVGLTPYVERWT